MTTSGKSNAWENILSTADQNDGSRYSSLADRLDVCTYLVALLGMSVHGSSLDGLSTNKKEGISALTDLIVKRMEALSRAIVMLQDMAECSSTMEADHEHE